MNFVHIAILVLSLVTLIGCAGAYSEEANVAISLCVFSLLLIVVLSFGSTLQYKFFEVSRNGITFVVGVPRKEFAKFNVSVNQQRNKTIDEWLNKSLENVEAESLIESSGQQSN